MRTLNKFMDNAQCTKSLTVNQKEGYTVVLNELLWLCVALAFTPLMTRIAHIPWNRKLVKITWFIEFIKGSFYVTAFFFMVSKLFNAWTLFFGSFYSIILHQYAQYQAILYSISIDISCHFHNHHFIELSFNISPVNVPSHLYAALL